MSGLKEKVPSKFYCPLTLTIMEDPLMTREGHSYEKSAILTWLSTHDTSPLTREPLEVSQLVSNHALRSEIHAWRERKIYVNMQGTDSDTEFISDLDDDEYNDDDDYYHGGNKKPDDISDAALFVFKLSPDEMKEYNWSRALLLQSMPGRDEFQEQYHQQQPVEDEEEDDGAGEESTPRRRRTRSNNINNADSNNAYSNNSNSNNNASSEESSQRRTMSSAMRSALLFGRRRRRASVSRDS